MRESVEVRESFQETLSYVCRLAKLK